MLIQLVDLLLLHMMKVGLKLDDNQPSAQHRIQPTLES